MTRSESPPQALGTRIPDFFIVGHPKCGTTALYEMLRRHPQIYMPALKETRWFARELHPRTPTSTHPGSLQEYLALFAAARPDQRAGEASPSYLRSREAAGRIAELAPDARIIAILREPASFLHSLHMELMRDHVETEKDLAKAIALEPRRAEQQEISHRPGLVYTDYVRYVEQLRRYHDVFPSEQVLVLIYDDFRAENEATVRRVMSFLGVDDSAPLELTEANPSVRVRSPRLNEMVRSLYLGRGPLGRALKAPIKAITPARVRRGGLQAFQRRAVYGKPQPADERVTAELRGRFREEVVALSDYLDRDLVRLWGYDGID
ncbi:MAG: sulfotransferase [Solirubrobacterales bacterium]|nr:sulfotransferase [Solirubrobacterales bacterium]